MESCGSDFIIRDNIFQYQGDDGINIHGIYWIIDKIVNEKTIEVSHPITAITYDLEPPVNTNVRLFSKDFRYQGKTLIKSLTKLESPNHFRVTLNRSFGDLEVDGMISFLNLQPKNFLIYNNSISNAWARGILVQAFKRLGSEE